MAEYIDRQKVIDMLDSAEIISDAAGEYCGYCTEDININSIPAADVAPVVHGKWVDNGIEGSMLSGCSVCGFSCGAYSFRYCPSCGAKMDLEENNG